jgi:hypothetical protein
VRAGVRRVGLAVAIAAAAIAAPLAAQPEPEPEPPDPPTAFELAAEAARGCEPGAVAALIAALPQASSADEASNALFTTARKCEMVASDPVTALALYQRIMRDYPDARAAVGAGFKINELSGLVGPTGEGADAARRFAALKARASKAVDDAALAEADALARTAWPGAGEVALWRAERLRDLGRHGPAAAAFEDVIARFPGTPLARRAAVGAAAVAIAANRFDDARERIAALPVDEPSDQAVRDELAERLETRQLRIAWYVRAWIVLIAGFVLLVGSLAHATRSLRGALRALRPPPEVVYALPVIAILIATAMTTFVQIIPPVVMISIGGLVLAWLSGAGLVAARRAGRPMRARAIAHAAITALSVAALVYIAVTRGDLLDLIVETVRFGPET